MMTPALRRFTLNHTPHVVRRLGRRGHRVPRVGRRRNHQRRRADGTGRLPCDGAGGLVRPLSVGACVVAQRNRALARHNVGPVSALLGCREAANYGLRDSHLADLHRDVSTDGRRRGRSSDRSGGRAKCVADRSRRPGPGSLACRNSAGCLQALWYEAYGRRQHRPSGFLDCFGVSRDSACYRGWQCTTVDVPVRDHRDRHRDAVNAPALYGLYVAALADALSTVFA